MNSVCKKEDKVINFTLVGAPSAKQCLIMVVPWADFSPLLAEQEEPEPGLENVCPGCVSGWVPTLHSWITDKRLQVPFPFPIPY